MGKCVRFVIVIGIFIFTISTILVLSTSFVKDGNIEKKEEKTRSKLAEILEEYVIFHGEAVRKIKEGKPNKKIGYYLYKNVGGLGNRLHGLMSVFLVSVITKRVFLMDVDEVFERSFTRNNIEWSLSSVYQTSHDNKEDDFFRFLGIDYHQRSYLNQCFQKESDICVKFSGDNYEDIFDSREASAVIATNCPLLLNCVQINSYLSSFFPQLQSTEELWSVLFDFLFTPAEFLTDNIRQFTREKFKDDYIIAIHSRTAGCIDGSKMEWPDPKSFCVSSDAIEQSLNCALEIGSRVADRQKERKVKYFASFDSNQVLEIAKRIIPEDALVYVSGEPYHVDRSISLFKFGYEKVLLDFYLIGESDEVVVTRNSTFSETAAARTRKTIHFCNLS